jgi:hypothetical protein
VIGKSLKEAALTPDAGLKVVKVLREEETLRSEKSIAELSLQSGDELIIEGLRADLLKIKDDGPSITAPFDADPNTAGIQTPEKLGNAVGQTASGIYGYDVGEDDRLAYPAGTSDFVDSNAVLAGTQIAFRPHTMSLTVPKKGQEAADPPRPLTVVSVRPARSIVVQPSSTAISGWRGALAVGCSRPTCITSVRRRSRACASGSRTRSQPRSPAPTPSTSRSSRCSALTPSLDTPSRRRARSTSSRRTPDPNPLDRQEHVQ